MTMFPRLRKKNLLLLLVPEKSRTLQVGQMALIWIANSTPDIWRHNDI